MSKRSFEEIESVGESITSVAERIGDELKRTFGQEKEFYTTEVAFKLSDWKKVVVLIKEGYLTECKSFIKSGTIIPFAKKMGRFQGGRETDEGMISHAKDIKASNILVESMREGVFPGIAEMNFDDMYVTAGGSKYYLALYAETALNYTGPQIDKGLIVPCGIFRPNKCLKFIK